MAANINIVIKSPYGPKSTMDLNSNQMDQLIDILDGHRDLRGDQFGQWFVRNLIAHTQKGNP